MQLVVCKCVTPYYYLFTLSPSPLGLGLAQIVLSVHSFPRVSFISHRRRPTTGVYIVIMF